VRIYSYLRIGIQKRRLHPQRRNHERNPIRVVPFRRAVGSGSGVE
jgi:hypothetical protein